ncbi:MAG TPA: CBS domain-containing protein [Solirubrobacterales bacterium]|nr:CBS domain-containing protein [Solirubrobacterales bacterium]
MKTAEQTPVAEAMRHGTLTCQAETSLRTVAALMVEHRIHSVVVTDLDGVSERAWGIVTEADVVRAFGEDVDRRTAGEMAVTELVTVTPDDTLEHAAQLMAEHEVTHLVVVGPDSGRPVGVLSSLDLAAEMEAR